MSEQPTKGPASYFPSIEKKYGKPIAEWQAVIRSHLPAKHMELVSMLKSEHAMGHGHANALVAYTLAPDRLLKGRPMAKNTICIWYDKDAEAAARFYAETFSDSCVTAVHRAPGDYPSGKEGDVLTVEFTVAGVACLGLNGGPTYTHTEAFSFQIATEDQDETDRYWNAIVGNGGQESACGWCKDRWGISWQITPRILTEAIAAGGEEAKRAFAAMMEMGKINVAAIEAARRG